ncbi:hypothetical protein B484DRAFT_402506 [Ochromonadaceae sp. CCMP2298]|nr:hypothetical protein B484DRAFT_402506 [Ochromonadaceae sp. CCMP2298]|mmetsp:Transcript_37556/g.83346  ORF Transcript_37556/g.83346 Transcript_37556/m.83346 type:complete len:276 (-) Transcript_37556:175-1002(-)
MIRTLRAPRAALRPLCTASASGTASATAARKKIVVFGGNGFVGSEIVKAALDAGHEVVSINRSGRPAHFKCADESQLTWVKGDIFEAEGWKDQLASAAAVVSTVGAFGSNEFMLKMNGTANINAITQALAAGVPRCVYISTLENNLPDFVLAGYFQGKRNAEQVLLDSYPAVGAGVVLRPGFIYGTRVVPGGVSIPLSLLGKPLSLLFANPLVDKIRRTVPGMLAPLAVPLPVREVARAAVEAAVGSERALQACAAPSSGRQNVLSIADIERLGA